MSMLAEPRRKQKIINLRAKNNAWSNDNNKFGQRMLEKMGWTTGKGLGANENGITEHVVARYKNDEKGLGFQDKNDQWTKHEDDFNALLANLSQKDDDNEMKLHSGVSLEHKSKKSKKRIHYQKFTRGKDLSRYSEKDLANIFGKKSFKEEVTEELSTNDVKITEQVFKDKGSMEDYFKNKMVAFKSKTKSTCLNEINQVNSLDEEAGHAFQGFLGTSENDVNIENDTDFNGSSKYYDNSITKMNKFESVSKTKKKKKKSKDIPEENTLEIHSSSDAETTMKTKKQKKATKRNVIDATMYDEDELPEETEANKVTVNNTENEGDIEFGIHKSKKKKKKKCINF